MIGKGGTPDTGHHLALLGLRKSACTKSPAQFVGCSFKGKGSSKSRIVCQCLLCRSAKNKSTLARTTESLILCRGYDVHLSCQMAQKSLHFICPHFLRMPNAMKTDEALDPVDVSLFGPWTVAVQAHDYPDPIEQFGRFGTGGKGLPILRPF